MRKYYLLLIFSCLWVISAQAQRTVSGTVTDAGTQEPLIGANIVIKGTTTGTITDFDGNYSLQVEDDDILVFSFVGYGEQELAVGDQTRIDVVMTEGTTLDEMVVTALGISREKKAVGYAVQELKGDEITATNEPNIVNALQGKMAGVLINSSSGAPGAGSSILIRGISSLDPLGSNQPLFVIDGIPISNQTVAGNQLPSSGSNALSTPGGSRSGEQASFTNRVADLNPNDIASINVLKGPAATALYGLRGANGVVVIETKRGQAGATRIDLSTSYGISEIAKQPDFQTTYREGRFGRLRFDDGEPLRFQSFGPKIYDGVTPVFNPIDDFFETGQQASAALSITGGTDKAQYITSFGYTDQQGIIPNSDWSRFNVKLGGALDLSDRLRTTGSIAYSNSGGNKPHSGDKSIMSALSYYPTTFDINDYIDEAGNQVDYSGGIIDNPRYLAENSTLEDDVDRVLGNLGFTYQLTDWLEADFKVGADVYSDRRERIVPDGTDVASQTGGFIVKEDINFSEINTLFFLRSRHDLTQDIQARFTVGHNMTSIRTDRNNIRGEGFTEPFFYDLSNTENFFGEEEQTKRRIVGLIGVANFSYKDYLYLDITGRNDWSSTLPEDNRSFFYPSVSMSFIPTEVTDLGPVEFLKLRGSWAQVAKDAQPHILGATYVTPNGYPFGDVNGFIQDPQQGDVGLKPERTTGIEFGIDARFLHNRLGLDVTWYKQNSEDQIIPVPVSTTSGLQTYVTNAGEIENTGWEILLNAVLLRKQDFSWSADVNFSTNEGDVISIADGVDQIDFFTGGFGNIINRLVPGGQVGDLYGYTFLKNDQGQLVIGEDGFPIVNTSEEVVVGNAMPDFTAGLTNTFSYKGFNLSALLEWREGGDVYDLGLRNGIRNGNLKMTERRYEEVVFNGVTESGEVNTTPVEITGESLYRSSTRFNRAADVIVEDASWFRLRRVSLGYTMPDRWFSKLPVQGATFTLAGNNLVIDTPFRGYDPETNYLGAGSNVLGFTGLQNPGVRTYTATLNVSF